MASIEQHLKRWAGAGVIDAATASAIREFEENQPAPRRQGPGLMEVLVYLGVAVAGVGIAILLGNNWEDLQEWARVAVIGVPAVLAIAAGQALRANGRPELERGGQLAWLAAQGLLAGTAGVLADSAGWADEDAFLAAGITVAVAGLALWAIAQSHLQVVGVGAGLLVGSFAFSQKVTGDDGPPELGMYVLAGFGAAALLLAEAGLFRPKITGQLVSAGLVTFGTFFGTMISGGGWAEPILFVVGAALIAGSIWRGVFLYVIAGVALVFAGLINTVARHAPNVTVAALALIVIGGLLIATVLVLAQKRPWAARAT
ncbi:MAG: DUF2157 domain-containing protein [Chloroflexi bacterium]|nr:DUF2157 domain-containing protein [Chloroflexota bacterium]